MNVGDRVRFRDEGSLFPVLGTVRRVSRMGYVIVDWTDPSGFRLPHETVRRLRALVIEAERYLDGDRAPSQGKLPT